MKSNVKDFSRLSVKVSRFTAHVALYCVPMVKAAVHNLFLMGFIVAFMIWSTTVRLIIEHRIDSNRCERNQITQLTSGVVAHSCAALVVAEWSTHVQCVHRPN